MEPSAANPPARNAMRTLKNTNRWNTGVPSPDRLRHLRQRLVRDWMARHPEVPAQAWERLIVLTASEAEALAWQTNAPLLVLPALMEEKLDDLRRYAARQIV